MHTKYTNKQTLGRDEHTHAHACMHKGTHMQPCTHANNHVILFLIFCAELFSDTKPPFDFKQRTKLSNSKSLCQDTGEGYELSSQ